MHNWPYTRGHDNRDVLQGVSMRDWYLPLAPIATIGYFLVFPDQFSSLIAWAMQHIR